ncbi:protein phosphatase inhibitor [Purpureocillium lavendulum]|uniref:Protein phosphatase inhibitor n=1 Tax=Purpureocillium lavendulum TaxID=1247861 RepID=A0AB34FS05_9HYPO|nr:protein phosphatase inhibitor [Purpureocillium lavendulum]
MSMPSASSVFDSGLDGFSSPFLDKIVRNSITHAMETLDIGATSPGPPSTGDLLNDMGDYCSRTAMMWALVTEDLLKGPHLEQALRRAHDRSCLDSGMSDLSEVTRIDMDLSRLRKIRDLSIEFSHQVQATWRPQTPTMSSPPSVQAASISPFLDTRMSLASKSLSISSEGDTRALKARKLLPDSHAQSQIDLGHKSDESDESDDELFLDIDMDALRQRGKGTYSCPKAFECKKGGVDKEGKLVIFDRNSSFAYVGTEIPI